MNVPMGKPESQGVELTSDTITSSIRSFLENSKSGYYCITVSGKTGLEEGFLAIENGQIIGAQYEYMAYNKEFLAGEALKRILNSFLAENGLFDSFSLTGQQLELLKIFNETILLLEPYPLRAFEGMLPVSFSGDYEDAVIRENVKEPSRESVMKKHGLEDIRVDNYQQVQQEFKGVSTKTELPEKVEQKIDEYLTGKPQEPEPTKPPVIEEESLSAKQKEEPVMETLGEGLDKLSDLDLKAEQLKRRLEKK